MRAVSFRTVLLPRRRNLRPAALLLFASLLTPCRSETASAAPEPDLAYDSWYMPLNAASLADPTNAEGMRKPQPGFKALGATNRFEAGEFVAALGLSSPPGSSASYSPASRRLVVRNTRANLDRLNRIFASTGATESPVSLQITLSVYECDFGVSLSSGQSPGLAYKDFLSLPEEKKCLLGSLSGSAAHAVRIALHTLSGPAFETTSQPTGKTQPPSFKPGQSGIIAEYEIVIGPDEATFDALLFFHWRETEMDGITPEIQFTMQYSGWVNYPQILFLSAMQNHPGRYRLVIGTCSFLTPEAWDLERLKAAARSVDAHPVPGS